MTETTKTNALVLVVHGLGAHPLRLTECGALPLKNGQKVRVQAAIAQRLITQYAPHLKADGEATEVTSLKNGHWEPVGDVGVEKKLGEGDDKAVKTDTTATTSVEGDAANKSMAGKTKTK